MLNSGSKEPKFIHNIYIIDDDPVSVFSIKKLLSQINPQIKTFIYPEAYTALDEFKETQNLGTELPELIFLDINMPVMDAWQFLNEFNLLNHDCKVVIVSSSIDPDDFKRSSTYHNIIGYIEKPPSVELINELLFKNNMVI